MDSTPRTVTLRRIDGEVSVPLPADVLAQSGLGDGSTVAVSIDADGLHLAPVAPRDTSEVMRIFEEGAAAYEHALRELSQ